ncbi:MAG: hypothetical protein IT305_24685 [Chloroflexi bacterium]|nr:hypothetical protein [Chloroflexota bacterium]
MLPRRRASGVALLGAALAGAWTSLALGLGAALGLPPDGGHPGMSAPLEHQLWTTRLEVMGSDPCTNDLIAIGAILTLDVVMRDDDGQRWVDADVRLDGQTDSLHGDLVAPLARRYAPYLTPIAGVPYVHTLRAPIVGRHGLDLVVDLLGAINRQGKVSLSIGTARIDTRRSPCSTAPLRPPGAPVTHRATVFLHA